jgi:RNA polymerase sigma factor (sigma-70 family)
MDFRGFTDDALLEATVNDVRAFGELYRRHEPAILLYFLRRVTPVEAAADLTAETFAVALEGASSFRGEGSVVGWLFGIARNLLRTSYRTSRVEDKTRRRLELEPLIISDEAVEILESLQRQTEGGRALELLHNLPSDGRAAIEAYVLDDRDYDEIAHELQCSPSVVRKRVSRGLGALRLQLAAPHSQR